MTRRRDSTSSSYHHGDLRSALIDATIELVREIGLDAVTMRAVAKRAGVSEAAPYHHFANKAELLAGAAVLAFRAFGDAIEHGVQTSRNDGQDPVLGAVTGYVTFGLNHPGEYQLIFGRHIVELGLDALAEVRAAGGASITTTIDALAESLTRRGSRATATDTFPLVRAIVHGIVDLMHEQELGPDTTTSDAIEMAKRAVDALLDGLQP